MADHWKFSLERFQCCGLTPMQRMAILFRRLEVDIHGVSWSYPAIVPLKFATFTFIIHIIYPLSVEDTSNHVGFRRTSWCMKWILLFHLEVGWTEWVLALLLGDLLEVLYTWTPRFEAKVWWYCDNMLLFSILVKSSRASDIEIHIMVILRSLPDCC